MSIRWNTLFLKTDEYRCCRLQCEGVCSVTCRTERAYTAVGVVPDRQLVWSSFQTKADADRLILLVAYVEKPLTGSAAVRMYYAGAALHESQRT